MEDTVWGNSQDLFNYEKEITEEGNESILTQEDYYDLLNEFCSIFDQKEIDQLNNNINMIIQYFYLRGLMIEEYINQKYKNSNNKRKKSIIYADYLFKVQFEQNISTNALAQSINQLISEINESYFEKKNMNDLSDKTYMNKIEEVFGTKEIPKFLLREGFLMRREMQKHFDFINNNKNTINENKKNDSKRITNSNNDNFNLRVINTKKLQKKNDNINIKDLIKKIENNGTFNIEKKLNEMYLILLILSFKEIKNENIYNIIEKNLDIFYIYFEIIRINNFREFKRKYMDIDIKDLQLEIYSMEFSQVNDSEYSIKYILAICYVVISQLFEDSNCIYMDFLLFLQNFMNFIPNENNIFKEIIENEINRCLDNNNDNNKNIYKDLVELNKNDYNNNYHNMDVFKESNDYHQVKQLNFNSIKDIFNNIDNNKLRNRFFQIVQQEETFEKGNNIIDLNILDLFLKKFKIREKEKEDSIKDKLEIIPYKKGLFSRRPILILISGYFSANTSKYEEWIKFINVYEKRFNNPIIYYYIWPASNFSLEKMAILAYDFKNARKRAKNCGKLLALMILSNKIFSGFKINLAAFSLGSHVLKHCIKELSNNGKLNIINNIIFFGGATSFKNNFKWEQRLNSFKGIIINCYSFTDIALLNYNALTKKYNIGTQELEIGNINIHNYQTKCFHLEYREKLDEIGNMFLNDLIE